MLAPDDGVLYDVVSIAAAVGPGVELGIALEAVRFDQRPLAGLRAVEGVEP